MTRPAMGTQDVLAWLKQRGTRRNVEGMAHYGIVAKRVFGPKVRSALARRAVA
jgi:hypothetical protein